MKIPKIVKKLILVFMILAGVLCLVCIGTNIYVRCRVKDRIIDAGEAKQLKDIDCIIVLGASVVNNRTPSPMLADRLKRGVELYFDTSIPKLLMSGDHGGMYYDEVNVMKNYAIDEGVPSEDIFMDHAGFSTYESMYRAKEVFGVKRVVIVTQRYHLTRALYIAEKLGLEAYGVAAEDISYRGQTGRDIREFFAITKDFFFVIAKPEPTVTGGSIDISGDGNVTNDRDN